MSLSHLRAHKLALLRRPKVPRNKGRPKLASFAEDFAVLGFAFLIISYRFSKIFPHIPNMNGLMKLWKRTVKITLAMRRNLCNCNEARVLVGAGWMFQVQNQIIKIANRPVLTTPWNS